MKRKKLADHDHPSAACLTPGECLALRDRGFQTTEIFRSPSMVHTGAVPLSETTHYESSRPGATYSRSFASKRPMIAPSTGSSALKADQGSLPEERNIHNARLGNAPPPTQTPGGLDPGGSNIIAHNHVNIGVRMASPSAKSSSPSVAAQEVRGRRPTAVSLCSPTAERVGPNKSIVSEARKLALF